MKICKLNVNFVLLLSAMSKSCTRYSHPLPLLKKSVCFIQISFALSLYFFFFKTNLLVFPLFCLFFFFTHFFCKEVFESNPNGCPKFWDDCKFVGSLSCSDKISSSASNSCYEITSCTLFKSVHLIYLHIIPSIQVHSRNN